MWFFIIILLLLIFLVSPIFKVWRTVRKFQDDYNRAVDEAKQRQKEEQQNNEQNDLKERYRRYTNETGEYVSFEEMKGRPESSNETSEQQPSNGSNSKYQDEIVSDAEFEDI